MKHEESYVIFTQELVKENGELKKIKVMYPHVTLLERISVTSAVQSKRARLITGAHTNTQTEVLAIKHKVNICEL